MNRISWLGALGALAFAAGCAPHSDDGATGLESAQTASEVKALSNLDEPERIYLFQEASRGNDRFIADIANVVALHNESKSPSEKAKISVLAEDTSEARAALGALVAGTAALHGADVAYLPASEGLGNVWLQDAGQFVSAGGQPAFLDIQYGGQWARAFVDHLKRTGVRVLTQPFDAGRETDLGRSNEGGNIEVLPTGDFYVGDTLTAQMTANLGKLAANPVVIPATQMAVGHVDEMFSIVPVDPNQPASRGCDYALLKADPLDGLRLLLAYNLFTAGENEPSRRSFVEAIAWAKRDPAVARAYETKEKLTALLGTIARLHLDVRDLPPFALGAGGMVSFEQWYVAKAILLQRDIDIGVNKLKERIAAKDARCSDLATISAPAIMGGEQYAQLFYEGSAAPADYLAAEVNFATPFANLVVIGRHLAIPAYSEELASTIYFSGSYMVSRPTFEQILRDRLAAHGVGSDQVHFVDATGYLLGMGAAHCGSIVQRRAKR